MSEAVAKRYAEALFQLGQENDTIDQFVEDLRVVQDVFAEHEQLNTFLKHPRISSVQKEELLKEVFQSLQKDIVNTLILLMRREHTEITPSIVDHFFQIVNDAKGIVEAKVFSVRELSDAEKDALSKNLATQIAENKQLKITNIVDPSLIGGLKVQVKNTVYDGSVSGKLKRMERKIMATNK